MIPQSFIEEVQSRTDIVELVSSYIPLKKAGRNFKATCPFHSEKTPSFMVSPQKQIFHCFGCGEGGGAFQFLTLVEKVTFPEAVEMLAKKSGLTIPYQKGKSSKDKNILYDAMKEAAKFFNNNLINKEAYKNIREYLKKRGIADKTINKFDLGYAEGNNSLLNHMRKVGFTLEMLEKASLIISNREGFRDLFHRRITFPIFDVRSRIIGFGARTCQQTQGMPKYINSLENVLYSKRAHLFGLNFSKEAISQQGYVIVTEGYLDMIIPFMRGIKNIIASLGTALTIEQIRLIKRYTSNVVMVYDSDKAGQTATLRSMDLLLENELKVSVVNLPQGYDPDSLVREKGVDQCLSLIDKKKDFFDYKFDILKNIHDITTIDGKTKTAQEMLTIIEKLSSEIEKYEYIAKLAKALAIKEEIVIAEFQAKFSKESHKRRYSYTMQGNVSSNIKKEPLSITEKVLFRFMFTSDKAFSFIKKNVKEEYFSSYLARKAITFLFKVYSEQPDNSIQKLLGLINDKEVSGFISEILMDDDIPLDKNIVKESLLKLRKKGTIQFKKQLQNKIRRAEAQGDKNRLKTLIAEYVKINSEVKND